MSKQSKAGTGALARAVATVVRVELARQGVSVLELSRRTGISHNYLNRRVRGEFAFTLNDLEPVSQAMGLSPDVLFSRGLDMIRRGESIPVLGVPAHRDDDSALG